MIGGRARVTTDASASARPAAIRTRTRMGHMLASCTLKHDQGERTMATRNASAQWQGNLKEGDGRMALGSGAFEGPFTFESRFEEGGGTNPEELIGAAEAGCFTMQLAATLSEAGHTVESVTPTPRSTSATSTAIRRSRRSTSSRAGGFRASTMRRSSRPRRRRARSASSRARSQASPTSRSTPSSSPNRRASPGRSRRSARRRSARSATARGRPRSARPRTRTRSRPRTASE